MKPAIITALILTAYVLFLRRYGAEPSVMTVLLIVIFSGGIGYFLRTTK
jgi:hypothetical protein